MNGDLIKTGVSFGLMWLLDARVLIRSPTEGGRMSVEGLPCSSGLTVGRLRRQVPHRNSHEHCSQAHVQRSQRASELRLKSEENLVVRPSRSYTVDFWKRGLEALGGNRRTMGCFPFSLLPHTCLKGGSGKKVKTEGSVQCCEPVPNHWKPGDWVPAPWSLLRGAFFQKFPA